MQTFNAILEILNAAAVMALVIITWRYARSTAMLLQQAHLQAEILIQSAKINAAAVKAETGQKEIALNNAVEASTALEQLLRKHRVAEEKR